MSARCIFITGGSRSGKSAFAQKLAGELGGKVLFVATAEAGDAEMEQRIAQHRRNRPKTWRTLEASRNIGDRIIKEAAKDAGVIVIDCLTMLVSNLIIGNPSPNEENPSVSPFREKGKSDVSPFAKGGPKGDLGNGNNIDRSEASRRVKREIARLLKCLDRVDAAFIIVSSEVGMGLVPPYPLGRVYRDLLGEVNQTLANRAAEVYFMAAGIPVKIK